MSSTSDKKVVAVGLTNLPNMTAKGFWNNDEVEIPGMETIKVNRNIYENGGGGNCRCWVNIWNNIATVVSCCHADSPGNEDKSLKAEYDIGL